MLLSPESKELLLKNLFYSPNTQFTSIKTLYDQVKNKKITYNEVRDFVQSQEATQLFKKQKRIKNYFPIAAKFKYEILQIDLVDMSDISSSNENYKFLLVCVDVFSRLAFVVPMKNKQTSTIIEAIEEVLNITQPDIINCDLGSEFKSREFKNMVEQQGITLNYVDVKEHHKLGIVDRFVRTLREKINKYGIMHNTTKYIDVLPKIIYNYNNAYHSTIKKTPIEVKDDDEEIIELTRRRIEKAKKEETKFNIGDTVRYILNKTQFEKGTSPKWSKLTHKILSKNQHSYTLDNNKTYKYYELQLIKENQNLNLERTEPTREELRREKTVKRRLRKEDNNLKKYCKHKENKTKN